MKSSTDAPASSSEPSEQSFPISNVLFEFIGILAAKCNLRSARLIISDVRGHHSLEGSSYVGDDRDHSCVFDPCRTEHAQRTDRGTAADAVWGRDQRAVLKRRRAVFASYHDLNTASRRLAANAF